MGKLIDLTGTIIGDIEILGDDVERNKIEYQRFLNGEIKNKKNYVLCKCLKCEDVFSRTRDNLKQIKTMCPKCSNIELGNSKRKDRNDIIGKRFGRLMVVKIKDEFEDLYFCKCDCGNDKIVNRSYLINNQTKSCGCLQKESQLKYEDLVGNIYNGNKCIRRVANKFSPNGVQVQYEWECSCGNKFVANSDAIKNGKQKTCGKCNLISKVRPDIIQYLKYKEDADVYTIGSDKKIYTICPTCGNEKLIVIKQLTRQGSSCPICGDNFSYGEKVITSILNHFNIKYKYQKKFNWSKGKIYDFYLYDYNTIIEVNGAQHYVKSFETIGGRSLKEEQENDKIKKELASKNNIKTYIELDCRKSEIGWIKNSILKSNLTNLIDFDNIDFEEFNSFAKYNTLLNEICCLYNSGLYLYEIANKLHIWIGTVSDYLVRGNTIGLCKFKKKRDILVVCEGVIFKSSNDCGKYYGLKSRSLCSAYLNNNHPMPKKWLDRGLRYYNPETDKDLPIYENKEQVNINSRNKPLSLI